MVCVAAIKTKLHVTLGPPQAFKHLQLRPPRSFTLARPGERLAFTALLSERLPRTQGVHTRAANLHTGGGGQGQTWSEPRFYLPCFTADTLCHGSSTAEVFRFTAVPG